MTVYAWYQEEIRITRQSDRIAMLRTYLKAVVGWSLAAMILAGGVCYLIGAPSTAVVQATAGVLGALVGALSARVSPRIFRH
jgi:hypothetical protein